MRLIGGDGEDFWGFFGLEGSLFWCFLRLFVWIIIDGINCILFIKMYIILILK